MLASGGATSSAKSPKKGILKKHAGFSMEEPAHQTESPRASSANYEKSARWDEMNILQTYHPPDKDYGHMKIDEPKTPYNYSEDPAAGGVSAEEIQSRLRAEEKMGLATTTLHGSHVSLSSEDDGEVIEETPEQRAKREMFEDRRKKHYNEGHLLKDAKRMVQQELEQLEREGEQQPSSKPPVERMDDDIDMDEMMHDADEMNDDDDDDQQGRRFQSMTSAATASRSKVTSSYTGPSPGNNSSS